jgi:small subunit ribosomal protein S20
MPNTPSAERRMRSSARRQLHNRSIKAKLKSLEKSLRESVAAGKKDVVGTALRAASAALDKAAKSGVIHRATANRKKSRLALCVGAK